MTDRSDAHEGFMTRWSRRKLKRQQVEADNSPTARRATEAAAAEAKASPARSARSWSDANFDNFDFSALTFGSDFTRFMGKDVPEDVRSRALKHLWTSSDIISRPDDLDDYLEDFSEEAMALPAELAKSAYEVGRGFVTGEAETSPTSADSGPSPGAATTPPDPPDESTPVTGQPAGHEASSCVSSITDEGSSADERDEPEARFAAADKRAR